MAVAGEHLLELLIDVGVGEVADQALKLETFPLGEVKLRSDFDRELEGHRAIVRYVDRFEIELRLADGGECFVFADLLQAIHQEALLTWSVT